MSARPEATTNLRQSVIKQQCATLHLPTVASQCAPLAEQAERERQPYLGYLEALFAAELEDRERRTIERRIKEAHLPRVKTLEEFEFRQAPTVSPTRLSELAEGSYIERAESVVFIGDSGTGKTHLLTSLCVAACRQRRRVRFITAATLVNEPVEAKQQLQPRRVLARCDVIAIDEVGYVPLAELGAEFLFQVIADRAEQAAVLLTTNLPFSEWTQVTPNARLCKALLDRVTDRAHIIETGSRLARTRIGFVARSNCVVVMVDRKRPTQLSPNLRNPQRKVLPLEPPFQRETATMPMAASPPRSPSQPKTEELLTLPDRQVGHT